MEILIKLNLQLLLLLLLAMNVSVQAQDYQIAFAVLDEVGTPEFVSVENTDQEIKLLLDGNDVLHLMNSLISIENTNNYKKSLNVYPNPTEETATIEFHNPSPGDVSIVVFDISGKRVLK